MAEGGAPPEPEPPEPKPPDIGDDIFNLKTKWCQKYVVMTLATNPLNKTFNDYSPFKICKFVKGYGPNISVKFLRNGTVLLNINIEKDYYNLKFIKSYDNINIIFSLHKSLNFSRGVIYASELLNCNEEEIVSELAAQGVTNVRRITRTVNGTKVPTPTLVITFQKPNIPEKINFDFMSVRVRPYEPNPMLCFSCYRYRHTRKYCQIRNCGNCGDNTHDSNNCTNPAKCINCANPHPAFDRQCATYIREKKIEKIRALEKVSYRIAENIVKREEAALPRISYSQAVLPTTPGPSTSTFSPTPGPSTSFTPIPGPSTSTSSTPVATTAHLPTNSMDIVLDHLSKLTNIIEKLATRINTLENLVKTNANESEPLTISLPKQLSHSKPAIKTSEQKNTIETKTSTNTSIPKKPSPSIPLTLKRDRPVSQSSTLSESPSLSSLSSHPTPHPSSKPPRLKKHSRTTPTT